MSKILAQIWNGNLNPVMHSGENKSEIKILENLMGKNLEELEKLLVGKERKIFDRYNDCVCDYLTEVCEQAFCDGFSLGVKIMTEALGNYGDIL